MKDATAAVTLPIHNPVFHSADIDNKAILHFDATVGGLQKRSVTYNRKTNEIKYHIAPWNSKSPPDLVQEKGIRSSEQALKLFMVTPRELQIPISTTKESVRPST
jgi:hypothetical protein